LALLGVESPVNLACRVEATMDQETLRLLIQRKIRDGRLPHHSIRRIWS